MIAKNARRLGMPARAFFPFLNGLSVFYLHEREEFEFFEFWDLALFCAFDWLWDFSEVCFFARLDSFFC